MRAAGARRRAARSIGRPFEGERPGGRWGGRDQRSQGLGGVLRRRAGAPSPAPSQPDQSTNRKGPSRGQGGAHEEAPCSGPGCWSEPISAIYRTPARPVCEPLLTGAELQVPGLERSPGALVLPPPAVERAERSAVPRLPPPVTGKPSRDRALNRILNRWFKVLFQPDAWVPTIFRRPA